MKGMSYDIYLSPAEANFGLNFDLLPEKITKIRLDTDTFDLAKIQLKKEAFTEIIDDCLDETDEEDSCSKTEILKKLNSDLNCVPAPLKHLNLDGNDCNETSEALEALNEASKIAKSDLGCPKSCSYEKYTGKGSIHEPL